MLYTYLLVKPVKPEDSVGKLYIKEIYVDIDLHNIYMILIDLTNIQ